MVRPTKLSTKGMGLVCDLTGTPYPDLIVARVNQEHGIVSLRPGSNASLPDIPIGSRVRVLPNHACATAAQFDRYHVSNETGEVTDQWQRISGW
ncbi:MAG TPA: hypothetical protein VIY68_10295 [Steroidobacteraceae bacterium]